MELAYVIAPLLGGVIGYITNDIAIRMLFRPHRPKYLFGIHIPFTPGIIPKEKGRIAEAIGGVISTNLMNQEVLQRYLLSDEMVSKIRTSVSDFIEVQERNDETVEQFLCHYITPDEVKTIANKINNSITQQAGSKLSDPAIGEKVAKLAVDHLTNQLGAHGARDLIPTLGRAFGGIMGSLIGVDNFVSRFLEMLREPTESFLARNINRILENNGEEIVSNMIDGEIESFLRKPVSSLLSGKEEQLNKVVDSVESIYKTIIQKHLPKILESVDISKIVRDRINEMDIEETEKLILQVMEKELKAIVWLGALLGMVMGSINIII